jgi:GTP-binding protein
VFHPTFLKSAANRGDFPDDRGREVAFVGRSNSGKSSAINALVGVRKLARVSKTPGRTQLLNFFELGAEQRVVDLPGYGFARVPPAVRERWRHLVDDYFTGRRSLVGLIVTIDIRRGPSTLDRAMLAWAAKLDVGALVLLTKADKLSRGAGAAARHRTAAEVGRGVTVTAFSAHDGSGIEAGRAQLAAWLAIDAVGARPAGQSRDAKDQ